MEKIEMIKNILMIAGGVAMGLPALLHAVVLFLKLIPGEQPEKFIEGSLLPASEKLADIIGKVFPKSKA